MHILFAWEQGGGYGHLAHIMPVARELAGAGHRVSLAARYCNDVFKADAGLFTYVLPAPNVRAAAFQQETRTFADVLRPAGFADAGALAACTRSWLDLLELVTPDALVCEHAFNALFAARLRGLPVARLGTGFTLPPASSSATALRAWQPHTREECDTADRELLAVLQAVSGELGGPGYAGVADLLCAGEEFPVTWPELDHMGAQRDRYYYGPMAGFGGRAAPAWPAGRSAGDPHVFMYLAPGHPLQAPVLEALAALGWPVILHARQAPPATPGSSMHWSPEPVDVQAVLPGADLLINHASHATCADAARHGCRMFLLPNTFERSLQAFRLVEQGLARVPVNQAPTCDELVHALRASVDSPRAPCADDMKTRYAAYDPVLAAAELAEDLLTYLGGE